MFRTYGLQRSADGKRIVLAQGGKPLTLSEGSLPKAPFGLESMASFQGALAEQQGFADLISGYYGRRKEAVLAMFDNPGHGSMRIPVRSLGVDSADLESEITREQYDQFAGYSLDEFAEVAARSIADGVPWSATNRPTLELAATGSDIVDRGIAVGARMAGGIPGGPSGEALPAEVREKIHEYFATWPSALGRQLAPSTNDTFGIRDALSLDMLLQSLSDRLAVQLESVAMAETGSFWLLGRYRWWEIIFWVLFGVLVNALIGLSPAVKGPGSGARWEPRETVLVFGKLFYAPILALAVFFLAGQFGLGAFEMEELGRSSPAILGVAFILGLFPNTTWRIIRDLCTRLFREDLQGSPKSRPVSRRTVTVSSTVSDRGGKPAYTVQDLKDNVANHVTAILKPGAN